jgi:hypothetical protein
MRGCVSIRERERGREGGGERVLTDAITSALLERQYSSFSMILAWPWRVEVLLRFWVLLRLTVHEAVGLEEEEVLVIVIDLLLYCYLYCLWNLRVEYCDGVLVLEVPV